VQGARLAADEPDAGREVGSAARSSRSANGTSTIPWSAVTTSSASAAGPRPAGGRTRRPAPAPASTPTTRSRGRARPCRGHPSRRRPARRGPAAPTRRRDPGLDAVRPATPPPRSGHRGTSASVRPEPVEVPRADADDVVPGRRTRSNTVGAGCQARGSTAGSQASSLKTTSRAGSRHLQPDQAVAARRQAGAEHAHARSPSCWEARRRAPAGAQRAQERRVAAAVGEQDVAEAVDEQDDDDTRRCNARPGTGRPRGRRARSPRRA
jgi:hypothetical protein